VFGRATITLGIGPHSSVRTVSRAGAVYGQISSTESRQMVGMCPGLCWRPDNLAYCGVGAFDCRRKKTRARSPSTPHSLYGRRIREDFWTGPTDDDLKNAPPATVRPDSADSVRRIRSR